MTETMPDFAVQFSDLSGRIRAERVNKAGNVFTERTDLTAQAIWSVAEWLEAHDDGEPFEIYQQDAGYRLERVTR